MHALLSGKTLSTLVPTWNKMHTHLQSAVSLKMQLQICNKLWLVERYAMPYNYFGKLEKLLIR